MADKNDQTALAVDDEPAADPTPNGEAPDNHEGHPVNPAPDSAWQQADKPKLSDEERIQGLDRDRLRRIAYDMLLARRFEEKTAEAYALGKIGGFCHLYIG
ncbi:MAG TPA: hypothetical protein VFE05_02125, partial [Longimicrobiaceae bacterium]|nr:hypothetical protein [Longimicrobiaceae bacterium]